MPIPCFDESLAARNSTQYLKFDECLAARYPTGPIILNLVFTQQFPGHCWPVQLLVWQLAWNCILRHLSLDIWYPWQGLEITHIHLWIALFVGVYVESLRQKILGQFFGAVNLFSEISQFVGWVCVRSQYLIQIWLTDLSRGVSAIPKSGWQICQEESQISQL